MESEESACQIWNDSHRVSALEKSAILKDIVRHIRKGESDMAIMLLRRYVKTSEERDWIDQYRFEALR